jgi:hypothetical protein
MIALPCPFCGEKPQSGVVIENSDSQFELGYCGCKNGACHVRPKVGSTMPIGQGEQSAIRRWNYRAEK